MPSRSEGRGGAEREPDRAKPKYLFKVRAQRVPCEYSRSAPIRTRGIASRKFIWNALRANFEQTAPPSLREGSPPDSGGDFPPFRYPAEKSTSTNQIACRQNWTTTNSRDIRIAGAVLGAILSALISPGANLFRLIAQRAIYESGATKATGYGDPNTLPTVINRSYKPSETRVRDFVVSVRKSC